MTFSRLLAATVVLCAGACSAAAVEPIALADCRITAGPRYPSIKARCGTLTRPEDPSRPDGKRLDLHVAVVPALSLEPAPDPFVPIAGGPGQASTEFYAALAGAFEKIRRNRDVVLLDQRGTGQSAPLACDLDEDVAQGRVPLEQTVAATRTCLDELPHDPRFFTTSVAITDLEALRGALGYPAFNLYGASYGTRVAQHFARQYPQSTRSIILDGVVPPQVALGPAIAIQAQKTLDDIFARCAEDSACAQRFPDLPVRFAALEESLSDGLRDVTVPHPVTGAPETIGFGEYEFAMAIRLLSYHPSTVALIPFLVDQAARGHFVPLASQFIMLRDRISDSLSLGMHNAVTCTEDAPFFAGEGISDEDLAATYIGPVIRDALQAMCSVWPAGIMDDNLKDPLSTDIPVLLLSGEADPITPPAFAELAAVGFDNKLHHVGALQGHGQAPRGCVPDVMAEFVESGQTGELDTGCLDRQFAMPFFLDYSGPAP